jgi:hypothetical protein
MAIETGVKGEPWTGYEIELTVALYMGMYARAANGEKFSKSDAFLDMSQKLGVRTKASVELKMCNISSVMIGLGWPHLPGLGPMPNIQHALVPHVVSAIERTHTLDGSALKLISGQPTAGPVDLVLTSKIPRLLDPGNLYADRIPRAVRRNYTEMETRNTSLGLAGELSVLEFEDRRLREQGATKLANRIEHVSVNLGDGLGYDIHSFEADGRDKLIEVKTTTGSSSIPFFISRNELMVSRDHSDVFCLSRVFDYPWQGSRRKKVQLYELKGSLDETCVLAADSFRAMPRAT